MSANTPFKIKIIYVEQCDKSKLSSDILYKETKKIFKNDIEKVKGYWREDELPDITLLEPDIFGGQNGINVLNIKSEIATFLSHSMLWEECVASNTHFLILEDDVKWHNIEDLDYDALNTFNGDVLNIGYPNWGVASGYQKINKAKHRGIVKRNKCTFPHNQFNIAMDECDCNSLWLFGAHAYIISPDAAKTLCAEACKGILPADMFIRNSIVDIYDYFPRLASQESYLPEGSFSNIMKYEA